MPPNPFDHDMRQCCDCGRVDCIDDDANADPDRCDDCAELHDEALMADAAWDRQFEIDEAFAMECGL